MRKEPTTDLRGIRERAGLTVREFARQLDLHHTNIVYWEKTGRIAKVEVLPRMSELLGVSIEELLGQAKPKRKGPSGRAHQSFERVSKLPRSQQKKILDVVDALLAQNSK